MLVAIFSQLLKPMAQTVKALLVSKIEDEDGADCCSVMADYDAPVALAATGVPNLG